MAKLKAVKKDAVNPMEYGYKQGDKLLIEGNLVLNIIGFLSEQLQSEIIERTELRDVSLDEMAKDLRKDVTVKGLNVLALINELQMYHSAGIEKGIASHYTELQKEATFKTESKTTKK